MGNKRLRRRYNQMSFAAKELLADHPEVDVMSIHGTGTLIKRITVTDVKLAIKNAAELDDSETPKTAFRRIIDYITK